MKNNKNYKKMIFLNKNLKMKLLMIQIKINNKQMIINNK